MGHDENGSAEEELCGPLCPHLYFTSMKPKLPEEYQLRAGQSGYSQFRLQCVPQVEPEMDTL